VAPVLAFETESYVVKPRDSLFGIAVKHGATLDLLKALNERSDHDALLPGQVLVVPVGFPRKWEDYEVRSEDTLSSIAAAGPRRRRRSCT
jgi:LysM repeat protein